MTVWKVALGIIGVGVVGGGAVLYAAFGAFLPWREEDEIDRLAEVAAVTAGQQIAEIGAGGGRFAAGLARRVGADGHVYATDVSPERLTELRARAATLPNLTVIEAGREQTNLPDGCCDLILMRAMYHHVGAPEAFVQSIVRALKPGGRVVVIDFGPGALWFHGGRPDDASSRRPGHGVAQTAVAEEFRAAGLTVERTIAQWSGPLWLSVFRR